MNAWKASASTSVRAMPEIVPVAPEAIARLRGASIAGLLLTSSVIAAPEATVVVPEPKRKPPVHEKVEVIVRSPLPPIEPPERSTVGIE